MLLAGPRLASTQTAYCIPTNPLPSPTRSKEAYQKYLKCTLTVEYVVMYNFNSLQISLPHTSNMSLEKLTNAKVEALYPMTVTAQYKTLMVNGV